MQEQVHWTAMNLRTYCEMSEHLKAHCPGKWVVIHDGQAKDDGGPPFFDTQEEAIGLSARLGILDLALIRLVPDGK